MNSAGNLWKIPEKSTSSISAWILVSLTTQYKSLRGFLSTKYPPSTGIPLQCPCFSSFLGHSDSLNDQSSMDWNRFFDWGQVGRAIQEAGYGRGYSRGRVWAGGFEGRVGAGVFRLPPCSSIITGTFNYLRNMFPVLTCMCVMWSPYCSFSNKL